MEATLNLIDSGCRVYPGDQHKNVLFLLVLDRESVLIVKLAVY